MSYSVEVIADSVGPNYVRLLTFKVRYPRLSHADCLRHRSFSRSVKSSRAKPILAYIKEILSDPAEPIHWGGARKGMQATSSEIRHKWLAKLIWKSARFMELGAALALQKLGVHKQLANRRLECDLYVDEVITATEESLFNFYWLRCGVDRDAGAQPELQKIARMMARAHRESIPKELFAGDWHLPFVSEEDLGDLGHDTELACRVSAARCARTSYLSFATNKKSTLQEDLALFDKLLNEAAEGEDDGAMHASPLENQAQALAPDEDYQRSLEVYKQGGNLVGWRQFRKTIPNEVKRSFDLWSINNDDFIIR